MTEQPTPQQTLRGTVERVTFHNPENGYSVLRLRPEGRVAARYTNREGLVTVVGVVPEVHPGAMLELHGDWTRHDKYGEQFQAVQAIKTVPASRHGLEQYLISIKGIGPKTAARLLDHFGDDTRAVLDNAPERLSEVRGISANFARRVARLWKEDAQGREVQIFLQGYGITARLASKIYQEYGASAIDAVKRNPYQLARDVRGIGFLTADRIAQTLGLAHDAPERVEAGLAYALQEAAGRDGHTYLPRAELVEQCGELLDVRVELVEGAVERACEAEFIYQDWLEVESETGKETVEAIYLRPYYYGEKDVAYRLRAMTRTPASRLAGLRGADLDALLARVNAESDIAALTEQQQAAVRVALTHKLSVLTGGPGTGKTTTLRAIIRALELTEHRFLLASPTGRAAKRLGQATGHPAQTIHRLLGWTAEGFEHNEDNPLDTDLVVIDEASMLDLRLANDLIEAIKADTHLLLVGDVDQLPSVGAGDVLRDIIKSGVAHVTRLDAIFRQAEGSFIITNAHRINQGFEPVYKGANDFFYFGISDPAKVTGWVVDIVQNRIPDTFGIPSGDVQVLAPMYRGAAGVNELNEALQAALNPPGRVAEKKIGGAIFRAGDRLMQVRNNYEKGVFNGDIGRLHAIDPDNQILRVAFDDDRFVDYDFSESDELTHAFAISVHKSQGSEYPAVVIALLTGHYVMLQRNLFYTAVTRAEKLVVLVGMRQAIRIAVQNNKIAKRYSGLAARLK
ncbi:MAG: ATP-dependent RecD-like DNA helicase [Anaerolineae bacterium]|nr:ATP-dependent RecD-like DNA helicase [Anaerolineae bacterium]